jgi:hypothetical protein
MYAAGNAAAKMVGTAVAPLAGAIGPVETIASKAIAAAKPALEDFRAGYYGDAAPVRPDPTIPTLATVTPRTAANASEINPPRQTFGGVTGSADTTSGTPALSDSGRPLGYGSTINGVRVFSDGSGGPGAPPATMTKGQIDALGNGNRLSIANPGIGGNIESEAFGAGSIRPTASGVFGSTPELGSPEGHALSRSSSSIDDPTSRAIAAARAERLGAQMDAESDLRSIATKDPRSALGVGAWNDASAMKYGTPKEAAEAAEHSRSMASVASGIPDSAAKISSDALPQVAETQRAGIDAAKDITRAQIEKQQQSGQHITLADGTLGIVGSDGVVRPATDPNGSPVHLQIGKPAIDSAAFQKQLDSNTSRLLGADPVTGQIPDPENPGKTRTATAAEIYRAGQQAKKVTNDQFGIGVDPSASRPTPDDEEPPRKAAARSDEDEESPVYVDANGRRAKWVKGKWVPVGED